MKARDRERAGGLLKLLKRNNGGTLLESEAEKTMIGMLLLLIVNLPLNCTKIQNRCVFREQLKQWR